MYDPEVEAGLMAEALRAEAALLPAERRLRVPGAARRVLGLHKVQLLALVTAWLRAHPGLGDEELFETSALLWRGETREEQFVATRLLRRRPGALRHPPWERIEPWLAEVDSVEGADAAAVHVFGPWAAHDMGRRLPHLRELLAPGDLVGRRVALVTTATFRSLPGYPQIALEFVKTAVTDGERLVVDAVVWALCALSRHHRELVEAFLDTTPELDALAREQVQNWLRTGSRTGLVDRTWRLPKEARRDAGGPHLRHDQP